MNRADFRAALRTALMQLDDYDSLRKSPLMALLPRSAADQPAALQRMLFNAIQEMEGAGDPGSERRHAILYWRFVEGLGQEEVALQLGFSVRHLRREQNNAIEELAERLLAAHPYFVTLDEVSTRVSEADGTLRDEIKWLQSAFSSERSDVLAEVQRAAASAALLTAGQEVVIEKVLWETPLESTVPAVIVREAMLTLMTALHESAEQVRIRFDPAAEMVNVVMTPESSVADLDAQEEIRRAVTLVTDLLAPFGATAEQRTGMQMQIVVTLPLRPRTSILVIDDNPDTGQLFRRYVSNTDYQLIVTSESERAVELALHHRVKAVIVDVIMPEADGWTVLSRLQHHPETRHLPVATCTILPHQRLSSALGAVLFLQKPVSRDAFLAALSELTAPLAPAPL